MRSILLRLKGFLQSWGVEEKHGIRSTSLEPSKSGVVGLLSNALGRDRKDDIKDLSELSMVVRVDQEGRIMRDYQTVSNILRAKGTPLSSCRTPFEFYQASKDGLISKTNYEPVYFHKKEYLTDACFMVGLEGPDPAEHFLREILMAIKHPARVLYLGRRACIPGAPIHVSNIIYKKSAIEVLKSFSWQGNPKINLPRHIRIVLECDPIEGEHRNDIPLSFESREYRRRHVKNEYISIDDILIAR